MGVGCETTLEGARDIVLCKSSRDLAYDEGMMDLVDLIDIAGTNIKPCTKRFLQRRVKPRIDELHQAY
ncbi:unnamed protein product, partial [Adineta steineri]